MPFFTMEKRHDSVRTFSLLPSSTERVHKTSKERSLRRLLTGLWAAQISIATFHTYADIMMAGGLRG